jgi:hypothetical protein
MDKVYRTHTPSAKCIYNYIKSTEGKIGSKISEIVTGHCQNTCERNTV